MIRNENHAVEVQTRRHNAGKRGVAKAVRRYLKRLDTNSKTLRAPIRWSKP
jgi:hypothetical protein